MGVPVVTQTHCIVQFSGGAGSYAAAVRAVERFGAGGVTLLFADTLMEDEDLYRFLDDAAASLGVPVTRISDGRDPWQVFADVRFLGNTRIDPCSKLLKRDLLRAWCDRHFSPDEALIALGIDWTEEHRFTRAQPRWLPWTLWAPLLDEPLVDKHDILAASGIKQPRLYDMGFPHNNCGGFCVKAGQAQFRHLWEMMPERYLYHEQKEQELRETLGDVAILRDRRGGTTKPMTLRDFRINRIGAGDVDGLDWGGCGCAID